MPRSKNFKLNTADLINRLDQKNKKIQIRTKLSNKYEEKHNLILSPPVTVISRKLNTIF